jgi:hypothetical protein
MVDFALPLDFASMAAVHTGCGRAGAWGAAHGRAAESAQADFVPL